MRRLNGKILTGLIINYIVLVPFMIYALYFIVEEGGEAGETFFLIYTFIGFMITLLYHLGAIKSWQLMTVFGFITTFFSGLFILIGSLDEIRKEREDVSLYDVKTPLEIQLEEITVLLEKGVLTREEHDRKRKLIIDQY